MRPATVGAVVPPDPRWQEASGDVRVLVIRATWGPRPAAAGDLADAAAFYERASFGKLRLKIDVTPWLAAYTAPLCPSAASSRSVFGAVGERAQAAAEAAGYDVSAYRRIAYILPERVCSPAGLGVGREVFLAADGGLLDDMAFVHELGHTFGLPHATRSRCARGCRIVEYGDLLSPMGAGGTDFTALEKFKLGWISGVQRVDRSRSYEVADIDKASSLPQALVVPTAAGEYWIERRSSDPRLVVRLVKPNDALHPVYLRSIFLAQRQPYVAGGLFSVTRAFRFTWLDRRRPTMPRVRALDQIVLWWTRSTDRDSGVAGYRVTLDGKLLAETAETSVTLPQLRGAHRLTVVALDRAGNRSRPGAVLLHLLMDDEQILAASVGEAPAQYQPIVVADYDPIWDEAAYVPPLEAIGYQLRIREPDWYEHRLLRGYDPPVNLHVFPPDCEEVERMLRFRDHLRTNEADRELYERTKRELAAKEWKYVQNYADAKAEVVKDILSRA